MSRWKNSPARNEGGRQGAQRQAAGSLQAARSAERGTAAFKDVGVRKDLKITESQVKNIDEILADAANEIKEIFKDAAESKNFKGMQEKIAGLNKDTKEKVYGVLTADQRKAYKEMIGEEFKFEQPKFGFGKKADK